MKNPSAIMKEYFKKIGSIGGKATSKKYGKKHYQKLAENMNKKRKLKKGEWKVGRV